MSLRSVRPLSIGSQLIVFITLMMAIILIVTSGLLYWKLQLDHETRSRNYLRDEIRVYSAFLSKKNGLEGLRQHLTVEAEISMYISHFVRVLDERGAILFETPGMERLIPVAAFPSHSSAEDSYGASAKWEAANGQHFMLKTLATTRDSAVIPCVLQVALDITSRKLMMQSYRVIMTGGALGGILISLLAAWWIARRGLRPLREITILTRGISADHLNERLANHEWPKELHELACAYDKMLDRMESSFKRLSNFTSNLAHEFRTPLNNLRGGAEVVLARPRSPEEYQNLIESNLEEYQRLSTLVDSLLFLARADNGTQSLNFISLELSEKLKNLVEYYEPLAADKEIALTFAEAQAVTCSVDVSLLRRAVSNLLDNSIRYTPKGCTITVSCRLLADGGVAIMVTDTGCGMRSEEIPRLFDRFYRVEAMRTDHPQGSGLGLSIVKSIMDLHGGHIDIQSQPGVGSTITLTFPPPR